MPTLDGSGCVKRWFGCNTDIQDLRDAQEAGTRLNQDLEARVLARTKELQATNARLGAVALQLQAAQRMTHVGSWEFDAKTGVAYWSDELYRILGLELQTSPPTRAQRQAMFDAESRPRWHAAIERCIRTGEGYDLALTTLRADGESRAIVARGEALRGASGDVEWLVGAFQDTTERDRVARQLQQVTERLHLATSAAKIGVWDWDVRGDVLVWDDIMYDLYGTERSAFIGAYEAWASAIHPDDLAEAEAVISAAVVGPQDFHATFRIIRPDGEVRHLRAAATAHRDPATGHALRMVGANFDITEKRVAEQALQRSEQLQRAILSQAGSAIITTDLDGTITLFNRAAERLLGYTAAEIVGVATPALIHDSLEVRARAAVLEVELGVSIGSPFEVFAIKPRMGRVDANEWTYIRKDGARVPVLLTCSSVKDEAGAIVGFLGVAVDLTEQKRHKLELLEFNRLLTERMEEQETLKKVAEEANRAKSTFLSNMSHEIRTPMNAILGMADLLSDTSLDAGQRKYVRIFRESGASLLTILNDILDHAKIEAGQLEVETIPFCLPDAVEAALATFAGLASSKRLVVNMVVEPDVPEWTVGDPTRVRQVIQNLIGNAVKFTERGEVFVWVRLLAEAHVEPRIWVSVRDTGPGIPEERQRAIFEPFTQADSTMTRKHGGTGLGLNIARSFARLLGGDLTVSSQVGEGSIFDFTFRAQATEAPLGAAFVEYAIPSNLRVLIVDDNATNRLVVRNALLRASAEAHVVEADSGVRAIALAAAAGEENQAFDIVLLDDKMPGLSGLQTAAAIRTAHPTLPILFLSSEAHVGDPRYRRLGADVLSKPIRRDELFEAIAMAIVMPLTASARANSLRALELQASRRILLVEDSEENRFLVTEYLKATKHRVDIAHDGAEAIVKFQSATYDLVLMDLEMPNVDGLTATRSIRAWELEHHRPATPIIALTSNASTNDAAGAREAGCTAHATKPIRKKMLLELIARHGRAARDPELEATAMSPGLGPRPVATEPRPIAHVNPKWHERIKHYLARREADASAIVLHLDRGEFADIARLGHSMKGSGGGYGFDEITTIGNDLELAARSDDREATRAALDRLSTYVREVEVRYDGTE